MRIVRNVCYGFLLVLIMAFVLVLSYQFVVICVGFHDRGGDTEVVEPGVEDFYRVIDAMVVVETGGGVVPGDAGEVGPLQVTDLYLQDVNKILRLRGIDDSFDLSERNSLKSSKLMVGMYTSHYGLLAKDNGCRLGSWETMCRIHNGGPDGWRDEAEWFVRNRGYTLLQAHLKIEKTLAYYRKVLLVMDKV